MPDELIVEYAKTLGGFTEEQLTVALESAKREATSGFRPSPGRVYDIASEIRSGEQATGPRDCPACSNTRYRIVQQGRVRKATLCDCVQGESRSKFEQFVGRK